MFDNWIFGCTKDDEYLYDLYEWHGHYFRVLPNGKITKADDNDIRVVHKFQLV